ncbi:hypothetical protein [Pseudoalteromonas byunsanensis]|uniref:Uncharacterized protein n=1 Tax=Pseudoalteromonas byunsanensis TaxID=327939 RepID=A0A1S1N3S3_9GAMM|nr:hypothetical protein [Pseudoalteromonas byunsanensis]OHU94102.1 hypothetical protein BIW53_17985 [Pseudoalteromonas byunsanensis]
MRGLIGIVLLLMAFALGMMVERLWLGASPQIIYTVPQEQSVIAADVHTQGKSQQSSVQTAFEQPQIAAQIETLNSTIARLNEQNLKLKQQLLDAQQQTDKPGAIQVANGDLSTVLSQQYQQETRDALWADELELLINDFLYLNDLSHILVLQSYGCKSTVCQMELVPNGSSDEFDETNWRVVSKKLFEQSWFKRFTISTSSSNNERMQIYLSTQEVKD